MACIVKHMDIVSFSFGGMHKLWNKQLYIKLYSAKWRDFGIPMIKKRLRPQPRLREKSSEVEEDLEEGDEQLPYARPFRRLESYLSS